MKANRDKVMTNREKVKTKREKKIARRERRRKIFLSIGGVLLAAVFVFLMVWFFGASYPAFEKIAEETFTIQGLKEGISPQGLCALPEGLEYDFAMCGYMVKGGPSRIYLVNSKMNEAKYFTMTRNGQAITSHFGGMTATKNYLMIADGNRVVRVPLTRALEAKNGAAIGIYDDFETDIGVAFCFYQEEENLLFVGEFYREQNYKTDVSHHLERNGETNYAFVYVYAVDETQEGNLKSNKPESILSVRGLVQGIAVSQDRIYLSCSYGLSDSMLYVYSNPLHDQENRSAVDAKVDGVPVYRLDKGNLLSTLKMPCMSEEICFSGGKLYILYESLCNKYKYFVRVRMSKVIALPLDQIGV